MHKYNTFNMNWTGVLFLLIASSCYVQSFGIKDFISKFSDKLSGTNRTVIPESAPVCGAQIFAEGDKESISPQVVLISGNDEKEHSFNAVNATVEELKAHGFRPEVPTTFLIHGFTSGYPFEAWMTGMVELFKTNTRISSQDSFQSSSSNYQKGNNIGTNSNSNFNSGSNTNYNTNSNTGYNNNVNNGQKNNSSSNIRYNGNNNAGYNNDDNNGNSNYNNDNYHSNNGYNNNYDRDRDRYNGSYDRYRESPSRDARQRNRRQSNRRNNQSSRKNSNRQTKYRENLFVVNWNTGADGINYLRAVGNVPIVASYLTLMIDRLTQEAGANGKSITLVGHSLGSHIAGFIGKNTKSRIGKIYGLDPAGPCFGSLLGKLYPSENRLNPSDADEVITVHTNGGTFGTTENIGHRSIFVEGGKDQPGCKSVGQYVSETINTWSIDGHTPGSCSHGRAPVLMSKRRDENCDLVAYECKDWDSFDHGFCGECDDNNSQCFRIGLDWQYSQEETESDRRGGNKTEKRVYFAKTGDTQPFCLHLYQVIVELNTPFNQLIKPHCSLVLEDEAKRTVSVEDVGNKMSDLEYAQIMKSADRTGKIIRAQLVTPNGFEQGRVKRIIVRFMSSIDPSVRKSMSSTLCPDIDPYVETQPTATASASASSSGGDAKANSQSDNGPKRRNKRADLKTRSSSTQTADGKIHRLIFTTCKDSQESGNFQSQNNNEQSSNQANQGNQGNQRNPENQGNQQGLWNKPNSSGQQNQRTTTPSYSYPNPTRRPTDIASSWTSERPFKYSTGYSSSESN